MVYVDPGGGVQMSFPVNNQKTANAAIGAVIQTAETEEQLVLLVSAFIMFFTACIGNKFLQNSPDCLSHKGGSS